jgi:hypothetical protein
MVLAHVREIAVDRVRRRIHRALGRNENPCHAGLFITANGSAALDAEPIVEIAPHVA